MEVGSVGLERGGLVEGGAFEGRGYGEEEQRAFHFRWLYSMVVVQWL